MTKLYLAFLLLLSLSAAAQYNYVPNPSFEDYNSCPDGYSQMERCALWKAATSGTSDYLRDCGFISSVGVPNNNIGYQEARTGVSYAGVIAYSQNSIADYKEYIEVKLKAPLLEGYQYKISYYISLAEHVSSYAIKNMGFVLSPQDVGIDYLYGTIDNVPLTDPGDAYYSDIYDWTLLEFTYTALGGENFLTIGNFEPTPLTEAQLINLSGDGFAYYFIDDVSVELDYDSPIFGDNYGNGYDSTQVSGNAYYFDGALMDVIIPNVLTVNSDGINEEFFIKYWGYINAEIVIVDRWGSEVFNSDSFITDSWIPENNSDGVYFYILKMLRPDGVWDDFQGNIQII